MIGAIMISLLKPINPPILYDTSPGLPTYWLPMCGSQKDPLGGDVADVMQGTRAATRTSGCTWATGPMGPLLNLNGSGSVQCGSVEAINNWSAITISTWLNLASGNAESTRIWEKGANSELALVINGAGQPQFVIDLQFAGDFTYPFDNHPHLITAVVNSDCSSSLYLDGANVATTGAVTPPASKTGSLFIGQYGGSLAFQMTGQVADFRWHNYAMTADQVWAEYTSAWRRLESIPRLRRKSAAASISATASPAACSAIWTANTVAVDATASASPSSASATWVAGQATVTIVQSTTVSPSSASATWATNQVTVTAGTNYFEQDLVAYLGSNGITITPGHLPQGSTSGCFFVMVAESVRYTLARAAGLTFRSYQFSSLSTVALDTIMAESAMRKLLSGYRGMMGTTFVSSCRLVNVLDLPYEANVTGNDDGTYHRAAEYRIGIKEAIPTF